MADILANKLVLVPCFTTKKPFGSSCGQLRLVKFNLRHFKTLLYSCCVCWNGIKYLTSDSGGLKGERKQNITRSSRACSYTMIRLARHTTICHNDL